MEESNWDVYWGSDKNFRYWQKPSEDIMKFMKQCDYRKQRKVLDLGCGIGRHAIAFAKSGFDVTALDHSKKAIEKLKESSMKYGLGIKTVVGNYSQELFNENYFDIILSYNVIYHGSYEEFSDAIELCWRYLKSSGTLFFTCPSRQDGKYGNGEEVAPNTYKSMNSVHPGDIHYFSDEDDLIELTKKFKILLMEKNEHYWDNEGKKQFSSYWKVILEKNPLIKKTGKENITK